MKRTRGNSYQIRVNRTFVANRRVKDDLINSLVNMIGDSLRQELADGKGLVLGEHNLIVEFFNVNEQWHHGCLCDEFPCPYEGPSDIPGTLDLVKKRSEEF